MRRRKPPPLYAWRKERPVVVCHLLATTRGLIRSYICWHLDFRLLPSKTARHKCPLFMPHSLCSAEAARADQGTLAIGITA